MATGDVPSLDLSLKFSDLASGSQLKTLLQEEELPAFKFAAAIAPYWDGPVEKLPEGTKLSFNLSQDASWKTSTGICFGLTGTAECDLEVLTSGGVVEYLDNLDATSGTSLPPGDYAGEAYVRLSLNFSIAGNVSGAGNVGALGISGNAKGSAGASLIYAHRVNFGTLLKDAIAESFAGLVFPFQPNCAVQMAPGDLAQVNFNGRMAYDLSLSYGLGSYNFTAPSVKSVLDSCSKGVASLTLPSATVDLGASFNLGCTHSDDFTAMVQKLDASHAFLYLMRAHKSETSGSAGVAAQVTLDGSVDLSLDQDKLKDAVDRVTDGFGGLQVSQLSSELATKLNDKVNGWIGRNVQGGASLNAAWDAQSSQTMITKYHIALDNIAALNQSWQDLCVGNLRSAVGAGGLTLDPGSGVSNSINRQFGVTLTFFNFFHAQTVQKYFQSTKVYITDTGDIRFLLDIGKEGDTEVNKALTKARIHFVADATATTPADVKLLIELSESNNRNEARHMVAIPGYLSASPQASAAGKDMQQFASATPAGTLNLQCEIWPSAYGKLSCSPYTGKKPPQDQSQDYVNWKVFHDASMSLLDLGYGGDLTYAIWQQWNQAANGSTIADRRHPGDWDGSDASSLWVGQPSDMRLRLNYFCLATSSFMNLCDDLHQLADVLSTIKLPDDWNRLLNDLKDIVARDVNTDFAKPAAAAILKLCAAKTVSYDKQLCGEALTCTLTLM